MTTEELRQLDAIIATKVMGWKHVGIVEPLKGHTQLKGNRPQDGMLDNVPYFTINRADAMLVLEKCGEKADGGIRYRYKPGQGSFSHGLSCFNVPHVVTAESMPLAIAIFAKEVFK